ncbi:crossover junction endodeoxyribonuclease RuvC [Knoellia koreensis]|uniref:Crossover junction endodeoxyribonuclease RuvC n=1 Tax=Knoellia koreensis TaxID=2730921 RepID=A0A849HCB3_9MICO|nr:crossover junction endodeoxyribonuclease RuvC [Knoellia sp. DB2414S]
MRVLGVDPGLTRCGIGVVEGGRGRQVQLVAVGVVRTPPSEPTPHRLVYLQDELERWLDRYQPEAIALEQVFADVNVASVMTTAHASAVTMLSAQRRGIPVTLHTPTSVKAAVTGSGRAEKPQVTAMVTRILRMSAAPKPADAADALALAICHLWQGAAANRLADAARTEQARLKAVSR